MSEAFVNLVDVMGGDIAIVNSAIVSYGKSSFELTDRDRALIGRLLRDKHGSPFEQAVMTFYVRCPIFVAREWIRHRMSSTNEISGRYKKLPTDFYTPKQFRMKNPDEKQMDYKYINVPPDINSKAIEIMLRAHDESKHAYEELLELGIANEQARIVVNVGIYTEFRWTVNSRALMNFLALRNHPAAMAEIRSYAKAIEHLWRQEMPETHAAFVAAGRVAP